MAVENHPKFPEFLQALNNWIDARKGLKEGHATENDVKKAEDAYNEIIDELDA
ncbi:MAG: hypothetical protein RLZZ516_997 [Cyanobacteriota bacterium]|jgi:hypothetical protein